MFGIGMSELLVIVLIILLIVLPMYLIFYLRKQYPRKVWLGMLLAAIFVPLGQWYLENAILSIIGLAIAFGIMKKLVGDGALAWFSVMILSSMVMYYRLLKAKPIVVSEVELADSNNKIETSKNILADDKLSDKPDGIPYNNFKTVLDGVDNMSIDRLHEIVDFSSRQYSYWNMEWAFSSADDPNMIAKCESEEWAKIYNIFKKSLIEHIPSVKELIQEQQSYVFLQHSIRKRIEYNRNKPIERALTSVLAHTSFIVNKIGLNKLGRKLYSNSLYPKGTIGRIT